MKGPVSVTGTSWFDQEFGSNQLSPEQAGWDWFALHLSDGRDLMIYYLRKKDGTFERESSGTLVERNGTSRHLALGDIETDVLSQWRSERTAGRYPAAWRIRVPAAAIDVTVRPLVADQELVTTASTGITYWEGAVDGKGTSRGEKWPPKDTWSLPATPDRWGESFRDSFRFQFLRFQEKTVKPGGLSTRFLSGHFGCEASFSPPPSNIPYLVAFAWNLKRETWNGFLLLKPSSCLWNGAREPFLEDPDGAEGDAGDIDYDVGPVLLEVPGHEEDKVLDLFPGPGAEGLEEFVADLVDGRDHGTVDPRGAIESLQPGGCPQLVQGLLDVYPAHFPVEDVYVSLLFYDRLGWVDLNACAAKTHARELSGYPRQELPLSFRRRKEAAGDTFHHVIHTFVMKFPEFVGSNPSSRMSAILRSSCRSTLVASTPSTR
jgi:hypothetical protein